MARRSKTAAEPGAQRISGTWFRKKARANFESLLPGHEIYKYLEVGSWQGASLFWVLEHLKPVEAFAVDPYLADSKRTLETTQAIGDEVEARWAKDFGHVKGGLIRRPSRVALPELITAGKRFDLVYVDGSHHGADVFVDAALASMLVDPGGILIFDDFRAARRSNSAGLRAAVDTFRRCAADDFELLFVNAQVGFQRREQRISKLGEAPGLGRPIIATREFTDPPEPCLRTDTADGILGKP
jgi:predicted O-methyltransferase YrrM